MSNIKIINNDPVHPFGSIGVSLHDDILVFNNGGAGRKSLNLPNTIGSIDTLFEPINAYFATLSKDDQAQLHTLYREAASAMDRIVDWDVLTPKLISIVSKIYKIIKYDDCMEWCRKNLYVSLPALVLENFTKTDISMRAGSNEYQTTTYVKDEYLQLNYLGVYLKAMIPIWVEYSRITYCVNTKSLYKERHALNLMMSTQLFERPVFTRLRDFIKATADKQPNLCGIINGIGTNETTDWLLSKVCLRKVPFTMYDSTDGFNLVANIYQFINTEITAISRRMNDVVRDKRAPKSNSEGDGDGDSVLESYRQQSRFSSEEKERFRGYIRHRSPLDLLTGLLSVYDENVMKEIQASNGLELERCIGSGENKKWLKRRIGEHTRMVNMLDVNDFGDNSSILIMKWIITPADYIPYQILPHIDIDSIKKLLVTSAIFCELLGYDELAAIVTGTPSRDIDGSYLGGALSRQQISKKVVMEHIKPRCPHLTPLKSKENYRNRNPVVKSIVELGDTISSSDWINHAYPNRVIVMPVNIRDILGYFVCNLNDMLIITE